MYTFHENWVFISVRSNDHEEKFVVKTLSENVDFSSDSLQFSKISWWKSQFNKFAFLPVLAGTVLALHSKLLQLLPRRVGTTQITVTHPENVKCHLSLIFARLSLKYFLINSGRFLEFFHSRESCIRSISWHLILSSWKQIKTGDKCLC